MRLSFALPLLLLLPLPSLANSYSLDAGIGVGNSSGMRTASLGMTSNVFGALQDRLLLSGWGGGLGSASVALAGQLGWVVNAGSVELGLFSGPTVISTPDQLTGSYLEFTTDLRLSLLDYGNNALGLYYRHISNAGLSSNNLGRDYIGLTIGWL